MRMSKSPRRANETPSSGNELNNMSSSVEKLARGPVWKVEYNYNKQFTGIRNSLGVEFKRKKSLSCEKRGEQKMSGSKKQADQFQLPRQTAGEFGRRRRRRDAGIARLPGVIHHNNAVSVQPRHQIAH